VTYSLELLDEALAEAEDAARWYAERSSTIAFDFTEDVDAAIARILQAPFAWPPHERQTRRFILHRFPFSIIYRVEGERVVVVAVAHASRDPDYWGGR
jgi:plasmid stabilization system protein ParE